MSEHYCLNCKNPVTLQFCSNCGQKTNTHRINFNHLFFHDILHGMWHMEKGILFTIKETLIRPGQAALDYIQGKRIRYYNVFYLILLCIGLILFISSFYPDSMEDANEDVVKFGNFFIHNLKWLVISCVPFLAINGYIIMDRLHLNLAEHFIVGGITLLGILIQIVFLEGNGLITEYFDLYIFTLLYKLQIIILLLYPCFVYINLSKRFYKWYDYLWRMPLFYFCLMAQIIIFSAFIWYKIKI